MKITIEIDHADIVGTEAPEFEALFTVLQCFTKAVKGVKSIAPKVYVDELKKAEERDREKARRRIAKESAEKNSAEEIVATEKIPDAEKPAEIDREEIETQIKKIALDGKETGASAKIKEIIQSYGVKKLSEIPDEKLNEVLEKVIAAV